MQMMIDAFHRENPQVEIKYLSLPAYDFWDSVQASIELGLQPDLIFLADRQCLEIHHPESFVDLREPLASSCSPAATARRFPAASKKGGLVVAQRVKQRSLRPEL